MIRFLECFYVASMVFDIHQKITWKLRNINFQDKLKMNRPFKIWISVWAFNSKCKFDHCTDQSRGTRVEGFLITFQSGRFITVAIVNRVTKAVAHHNKLLTQWRYIYTHAIIWFPPSFLAVNHHNIKNWVPSIVTHNLWLIFMGMKQNFFFFFEKKNSKWPTQKNWVFQLRQKLSNFRQISWIGPWDSRIDWCEGHQCDSIYMVVKLCSAFGEVEKLSFFESSILIFFFKKNFFLLNPQKNKSQTMC